MNQQQFTEEFIERMYRHALWQHPFFELVRTEPSLDILRQWAIQAGRIDEVFAEILTNMLNNPSMPPYAHPSLAENRNDELGNGNAAEEHFTLFRNVLSAIGVSEQQYRDTSMTQGTARIVTGLLDASRAHNPIPILGMMASEELICPREFPIFVAALRRYVPRDALRYFDVHIEADVHHSEDLIRLCYQAAQGNLDEIFRWQAVDLDNNVRFYDSLASHIY